MCPTCASRCRTVSWPKRAKELKATQDGVIVIAKGTVTESISIGIDDRMRVRSSRRWTAISRRSS